MPTPPRKAVAPPSQQRLLAVKMVHTKSTPNTRVYTAVEDGSAIPTLYIKKSAGTPTEITVTITG